jgi:ribosome maturation factor RimP
MITKDDITKAAEVAIEGMGNNELFVVEVKALPGDEFEVYIDSDDRVTVDDCIAVSRAIEEQFDREVDDFALTVSSAGIGQPLRTLRQYQKLVGGSTEVVLTSGVKILATLEAADEAGITLSYPEKRTVEGKKRPEIVTVTKTFAYSEIKSTKEYLDFK